jgi:integrase
MSLEPYQRGATWWAKGRVDYNRRPITGYLRESTGAHDEAGARDWINIREETERRRYLVGEEALPVSFADAAALYTPNVFTAKYLVPILAAIGTNSIKQINGVSIRALGPLLYPDAAADTWQRQVITPVKAVLNAAHDSQPDLFPKISVKGYTSRERIAQDKKRGRSSRRERTPGDWNWILAFNAAAPRNLGTLALFMFATGARIGQAIAMTPHHNLDLQNGKACIPAAKGHDARWISLPPELVVALANLTSQVPRTWAKTPDNLRVFGYATRWSVYKEWRRICSAADIDYLPPHSAGRHGFGQEYTVRQPVDASAASDFGGWSDPNLMISTYTHSQSAEEKIHARFRTGLVQAERKTGIKLLK